MGNQTFQSQRQQTRFNSIGDTCRVGDYNHYPYKGQQTVCGTIDSIADAAEQVEVRAPAVIVIDELVKLRERLQWFECSGKSSTFLWPAPEAATKM